jgi:hypothetical protein
MASDTTSKSESKRTSKTKSTPENSSTTKAKKATAAKASTKKDLASADKAEKEITKKPGRKPKAESATAAKAETPKKAKAADKTSTGAKSKTKATDKPAAESATKKATKEKAPAKAAATSKKATKTTAKKGTTAGEEAFDQFLLSVRTVVAAPQDGDRDLHTLAQLITSRADTNAEQAKSSSGKATKSKKSLENLDKKKSALEAAIVLTSPGLPLLYHSEELSTGILDSEQASQIGEGSEPAGMVRLLRDLAALSRNEHGTTRGLTGQQVNVFHINNHDKVLAFHRFAEGGSRDSTVVLINLSGNSFNSYSIGLPEGGTWKVRFNSDWKGYDEEFGGQESHDSNAVSGGLDNMSHQGHFGLGAYSTVILSLE